MDGLMDQIFSEDPYLAFQPAFAYTLPIQLLVSGITLTLLCVLAIHLIFTTQYHYPLAPLNYILQFFSILTVLISVFIRIILILQHSGDSADTWPYSLDYVSVAIPPKSWSLGQDGAWFLLQGLNSGFANLAHIQFLTLLYPSRTEARLIVFILGPLALASAFLVFTALSPSQTVLDLGDAIRNVFNSTLLLIFTIALLIWGLLVNRKRAWRTDGGTAIFGGAAIFLATVNTACNFVAVKEDGIDWLQHLLYCSILWQTWLGWWWWVGSGMGIGEVEDIMERAEKKKKRLAKKASKQRSQAKSKRNGKDKESTSSRVGELGQASAVAMAGFTSSVQGILRGRNNTLTRRRASLHGESGQGDIELDNIPRRRTTNTSTSNTNPNSNTTIATPNAPAGAGSGAAVGFSASTHSGSQGRPHLSSTSETSSTSHTPSLHPPRTIGQFLSYPTTWLWVYTRQLRRAHEDAAKKQAIERAERRSKVFGEHVNPKERQRPTGDEAEMGWGLGAFGIREHEEGERRLQEAGERLREDRLLPDGAGEGGGVAEPELEPETEGGDLSSTRTRIEVGNGDPGPSTLTAQARSRTPTGDRPATSRETTGQTANRDRDRPRRRGEEDWTDVDDLSDTSSSSDNEEGGGKGWSWWGPLRKWRLADKSTF